MLRACLLVWADRASGHVPQPADGAGWSEESSVIVGDGLCAMLQAVLPQLQQVGCLSDVGALLRVTEICSSLLNTLGLMTII